MRTALFIAIIGIADVAYSQVIDNAEYPSDAAARAAWQPMGGTAAVGLAKIDDRAALRMPCNFAGTKIERASWDRAVTLDLSAARGITFDILCRDRSPVGHFNVYLGSGQGWYTASFSPSRSDGWCTITVNKEDTHIEGRPDGWGKVSVIRISAWRGQDADTEFWLSNLRAVPADSDVWIIRGESAARQSPGELPSVCEFTQSMAGMLRQVGVGYRVVSDLDLPATKITGKELLILPHNPAMSVESQQTLISAMDRGAKVLAFYSIPTKLASAAGIEIGRHVSAKQAGDFASIRFVDLSPAGAPAVVQQNSWNIYEVKAVPGRSHVAAYWHAKDGKSSGLPAIITSDRCVYMSHVLLGDDPLNKRRMLLAMAAQLCPQLWHEAASRRVQLIGALGPHENIASLEKAIESSKMRQAQDAMSRAQAKLAEARKLLDSAKPIEAMTAADESQRLLIESFCLAQKPQPGEHRAFWCHSAFGPAGMSWDESIRTLADNGFTAILPNMLWGGSAYFDSKVLPVAPKWPKKATRSLSAWPRAGSTACNATSGRSTGTWAGAHRRISATA